MNLPQIGARRDDNEGDIIDALEKLGFSVEQVSLPGHPDLLLSRAGHWHVAEVKAPCGRETKAQLAFRRRSRAPIPILRSVDDVIAWERGLPR